MTRYGHGSGRLGYGLLLNSTALELTIEEVQDQRGYLVMRRRWGTAEMLGSGWYTQSPVGLPLILQRAPFSFADYCSVLQLSEAAVLQAGQDALRREQHRLATEDEGGAVASPHRHVPTDAEIKLKVAPAWPEPYGQAGVQLATNMKMLRAIDRRMDRLEHGGWDMAEVGDLALDVLRRVSDDTEARADARQRPQVSAAPPQLTFEDAELTRIFSLHRRDVGLGPVDVEPEPWPAGQTEGERLKAMQEAAGLTSAQLLLICVAEALTRHELVWLGWVSVCDPRFEHDELTTLGAARFPINGMWRPAIPGLNASNRQRHNAEQCTGLCRTLRHRTWSWRQHTRV